MNLRCKRLYVVLGIGLLISLGAPALDQRDTRRIMNQVFEAIAYLMPLSLYNLEERQPGDAAVIESNVDILAEAAEALQTHSGDADMEFRLLAQSFGRGVEDIRRSFLGEHPAFAYFALLELTQHCAACHSRLPDQSRPSFGERLMARMDASALDRIDLAQLYVATREFDKALTTLEKELLDPNVAPLDSDLAGTFIDYLTAAVGVAQNLDRARGTLGRFLQRSDVPYYLRRRIGIWLNSMEELAPRLAGPLSVRAAREVLTEAVNMTSSATQARAVHDLVAASLLRRFLEGNPKAPASTRAEVYFLLGGIARRTYELKPAVPEMELLLEAAIRTAPRGPHAKEAYALLEEYGYANELLLFRLDEETPLVDLAELRQLIGL
jgi:hypothetical protein